jgi:hypothetical protein
MKPNVGSTDRIIRLIVGIVIILIGAILNSWWGLIGVFVFLTGLVGQCAVYRIFKMSTCKTGPEPEEPPKG